MMMKNESPSFAALRVQRIAQPITQQIEGQADDKNRRAGRRCHPPLVEHIEPAVGNQRARRGNFRRQPGLQSAG